MHEGVTLPKAIKEGFATTVSNGSFKDKQGTTAWMFYDSETHPHPLVRGNSLHPVRQNPRDHTKVNWQAYIELLL